MAAARQGHGEFDKDKSIEPFAVKRRIRIKTWRKDGFFKKLEPHEIKLSRSSAGSPRRCSIRSQKTTRTRAAANDEITLWPDKVMPGNKRMDFHDKARPKRPTDRGGPRHQHAALQAAENGDGRLVRALALATR